MFINKKGQAFWGEKIYSPNLILLFCVSTMEKTTIEATDVTAYVYECFNVFTLPNIARWEKKSSDKDHIFSAYFYLGS